MLMEQSSADIRAGGVAYISIMEKTPLSLYPAATEYSVQTPPYNKASLRTGIIVFVSHRDNSYFPVHCIVVCGDCKEESFAPPEST